jgi:hypothetical protein
VQVVPQGFPSFPCPACGGALPATMPAGLRIPCPICRQAIVVPMGSGPNRAEAAQFQAWAQVHGNTAAALSDARAPSMANRIFASTSTPVVVEDGRGGLLVVGAQVSAEHGWWLRAIDPATGQTRWDALAGSHFVSCPDWRTLVGRGGRIYLAHEGAVTALDAATGQPLWRTPISARISADPDRAPLWGDETELTEAGGVVLLRTEDDLLWALDRERGTPIWRRAAGRPLGIDGERILLELPEETIELLRVADGARIGAFKASEGALVAGGALLAMSQQAGDDEVEGVGFVDGAGQLRWFVAVESPKLDDGCVAVGQQILACVEGSEGTRLLPLSLAGGAPRPGFFARLFGAKGAASRPLGLGKFNVSHVHVAGDALVIDGGSWDGERRIVIVDAATLAVRHDSGVIADGVAPGVRLGPGLVIYSFGESNGPKEVRAVDPASGALRWQKRYEDLDEILFRAGRVVMGTRGAPLEILEPATGAIVATFVG